VSLENERILNSIIEEIDKASFSKTSLNFFKGIPKTMKSILKFSGSSDNEKVLAAQVYGKLLSKFSSFGKEIKNKQIIPNKEELNSCEEVIDNFYNSNEELLRDIPETAAAMKITKVQSVLSTLKTIIQQMKSENPPKESNDDKNPPMTWRGFSVLLIIFGGLVLLVWFIVYTISKEGVKK
jgi:hypothetical protein